MPLRKLALTITEEAVRNLERSTRLDNTTNALPEAHEEARTPFLLHSVYGLHNQSGDPVIHPIPKLPYPRPSTRSEYQATLDCVHNRIN